jgi:hypothetical protein
MVEHSRLSTAWAAFSTGAFATMSVACLAVIWEALELTAITNAKTRKSFIVKPYAQSISGEMRNSIFKNAGIFILV